MNITFEHKHYTFYELQEGDAFIIDEQRAGSPYLYLKISRSDTTGHNAINLSITKLVHLDFDTLVIPVEAEMIVKQ